MNFRLKVRAPKSKVEHENRHAEQQAQDGQNQTGEGHGLASLQLRVAPDSRQGEAGTDNAGHIDRHSRATESKGDRKNAQYQTGNG